MELIRCIGCRGRFKDINGPVHRNMWSSPGCWATYGEVLAYEYSHSTTFEVLRLTVDT